MKIALKYSILKDDKQVNLDELNSIEQLSALRESIGQLDKIVFQKIEKLQAAVEKDKEQKIKSGEIKFSIDDILNKPYNRGSFAEYEEKKRLIEEEFEGVIRNSGLINSKTRLNIFSMNFDQNKDKDNQFSQVKKCLSILRRNEDDTLLDIFEHTLSENGSYCIVKEEGNFKVTKSYYGRMQDEFSCDSLEKLLEYIWENHPYKFTPKKAEVRILSKIFFKRKKRLKTTIKHLIKKYE